MAAEGRSFIPKTKPLVNVGPPSMSSQPYPEKSAESAHPKKALSTAPPLQEQASTPYTIFTPQQKRLITILLGLSTITSPLTATIYFPLLPLLREHFNTSAQAINLTITIYIIFQAISPALFGTLSDSVGRRPIYLITLTLYIAANQGLALKKDSYAALLVLRALQSLGASATYAVSYGVVADVCVPAERGKMIGPMSSMLNLGTCIGPIIGGLVALRSGGYDWVFWSLVIIGGGLLISVGTFLPETARNLVSNGILRVEWWEKTWWSLLFGKRSKCEEISEPRRSQKFKVLSLLDCIRIIFWKDTFLVLWMHGSYYLVDYCIQTAIPSAYKDIYHFNELEIGLSYLPRGVGIIVGGFINGKMMDYNYKAIAKEIGHTVDRVGGDDLDHFPIERARTRDAWYMLGVYTCGLIGYGWAFEKHSHVSIPLILQFLQGLLGTCLYTVYSTLLIDIFPASPSTAAAAASITRCALAASGVAVLQPLLDALGRGWYFTVLALVSGAAGSAAVWGIQSRGMRWRGQRLAKTRRTDPSTEGGLGG